MKKIYFMLTAMLVTLSFSSCKNGQPAASTTEETEEPTDYTAIVEKEFPSIDEFFKLVDNFQQGTKNLTPTSQVWDDSRKAIDASLTAKGFTLAPKSGAYDITATKNCKFVPDETNFTGTIEPEEGSDVAAAIIFRPCGDMYDKGEIIVSDANIYNAIIDKIKAAGYEETPDHPFADVDSKVFAKGVYFFKCNDKEKHIELHYDFMKAQELQF